MPGLHPGPLKNLLDLSAAAVREQRGEERARKVDQLVALAELLVRASEATGVPDHAPAIRHYRAVLYERYRYADTRGLFMREKEGPGEGIERSGRFFAGWFQALAREGVEVGAQESPQERAAALTADVLARPRIREMAQNPMLCTLIVLVHRSRTGRLPERGPGRWPGEGHPGGGFQRMGAHAVP